MEDTLQALIALQTLPGDTVTDQALDYIAMRLKRSDMHIATYHSGGYGSLVASTQPHTKHFKVLLAAHIDVVPGPEELFQLRVDGSKYTGRGVFDMKFAAAAYLRVVDALADHIAELDFGIMITTDEEVGGEHGVKYLLERGYSADICLLPDGADSWRIEASAKGGWHVRVSAKGINAHGSRPWEGDNAIEKLLAFEKAARKLIPPPQQPTDTTMVVSMISGGDAVNQVPSSAELVLDIRYLDNSTQVTLSEDFNALAKVLDVTISTVMLASATSLETSLPLVGEWEAVVEAVRGVALQDYSLSFGSSDARYLSAAGVPTLVTRPHGGSPHADGEWIDMQGYEDFCRVVRLYIQKVAIKQTKD